MILLAKSLTVVVAALLLAGPLPGADNPFSIPPRDDEQIHRCFNALFNLRFEEADQALAKIKGGSERHPMIALAQVVRRWWEMSVDVLEGEEKESRAFNAAAEHCLRISEKRIDRGDKNGEAHFAMGTALGLMSRYSASNRAWLPAYVRGHKSAARLKKALALNPRATDAYLTLGTFNYARELIGKRMGNQKPEREDMEGAEETGGGDLAQSLDGLAQLRAAYQNGTYFRIPAGILLAGILTNEKPKRALPVIVELREDMPQNPFVHMIHITALYNAGRLAEMERETEDYAQRISSGTYDRRFAPQARFAKGLVLFRQKAWRGAAEEFDGAGASGNERNPYVTWSKLYAGYAWDAAGQRAEARKRYQAVLKARRRFASHEHARARMEKAFRPTDVEMKKLEL